VIKQILRLRALSILIERDDRKSAIERNMNPSKNSPLSTLVSCDPENKRPHIS
jgi:hypothetical protein